MNNQEASNTGTGVLFGAKVLTMSTKKGRTSVAFFE